MNRKEENGELKQIHGNFPNNIHHKRSFITIAYPHLNQQHQHSSKLSDQSTPQSAAPRHSLDRPEGAKPVHRWVEWVAGHDGKMGWLESLWRGSVTGLRVRRGAMTGWSGEGLGGGGLGKVGAAGWGAGEVLVGNDGAVGGGAGEVFVGNVGTVGGRSVGRKGRGGLVGKDLVGILEDRVLLRMVLLVDMENGETQKRLWCYGKNLLNELGVRLLTKLALVERGDDGDDGDEYEGNGDTEDEGEGHGGGGRGVVGGRGGLVGDAWEGGGEGGGTMRGVGTSGEGAGGGDGGDGIVAEAESPRKEAHMESGFCVLLRKKKIVGEDDILCWEYTGACKDLLEG
ncbi:hypothetical protein BC829DRAFT_480476 [Chytridium lagenaria]|nr:hypothetical protein BC829DRAFT_480476 [Chytridium lagenaria]